MARRSREDDPGSWHHVINRGLAKRPLFEDRVEIRFFLSRLAREVRRGRIEVHAYTILTTHFHLLVRSPVGELSEALRRSQNEYSRFFNRRHKRDGSLIRGRFFSRPVTSLAYRRNVVHYIDHNAVAAGLTPAPWLYPWCSAASYAFSSGPRWLERSWVELDVSLLNGAPFRGEHYLRSYGGPITDAASSLVEARIHGPHDSDDDLDDLIGSAPPKILAWMKRKTKLADGTRLGLPVCGSRALQVALRSARESAGDWKVSPKGRERCAWTLLEAGLLRTMAGITWEQIATATGSTLGASQRNHRLHCSLIEDDPTYGLRAAEIGAEALGALEVPVEKPGRSRAAPYGQ